MTIAEKPLKRRAFLAALFGYLAFLGLLLLVFALFRQIPSVIAQEAAKLSGVVLPVLLFIYLLVFWQMVFVTLLGLYYLTDRIHR
jgi:ACR3 family arsenite efflux pump ArsB